MGGGRILSPNLLFGRKTLLKVPEIGTSSHLRMYLKTKLSKFSITHVFGILATVKCQDRYPFLRADIDCKVKVCP